MPRAHSRREMGTGIVSRTVREFTTPDANGERERKCQTPVPFGFVRSGVKVTGQERQNAKAVFTFRFLNKDDRKAFLHGLEWDGYILELVQEHSPGERSYLVIGTVEALCDLEDDPHTRLVSDDAPNRSLQRLAAAVHSDGHVTVTAEGATAPPEKKPVSDRYVDQMAQIAHAANRLKMPVGVEDLKRKRAAYVPEARKVPGLIGRAAPAVAVPKRRSIDRSELPPIPREPDVYGY